MSSNEKRPPGLPRTQDIDLPDLPSPPSESDSKRDYNSKRDTAYKKQWKLVVGHKLADGFPLTRLPTKQLVMQRYYTMKLDHPVATPISLLASKIYAELKVVWDRVFIPTVSGKACVARIRTLLNSWDKKDCRKLKEGSQKTGIISTDATTTMWPRSPRGWSITYTTCSKTSVLGRGLQVLPEYEICSTSWLYGQPGYAFGQDNGKFWATGPKSRKEENKGGRENGIGNCRTAARLRWCWRYVQSNVIGMIWDTTASNTGRVKGSALLFEEAVGQAILWIACSHHVAELHVHWADEIIRGVAKGLSLWIFC